MKIVGNSNKDLLYDWKVPRENLLLGKQVVRHSTSNPRNNLSEQRHLLQEACPRLWIGYVSH